MSLPISNLEYMDDTIKNNHLVVPNYQRGISWEEPEIMDLMNDIMDVYAGNEDQHFLGQIVTYQEDDNKIIVDGQQRLSASLMFYAAIKSIAKGLIRQYKQYDQLTDHLRDGLRDIIRDINKILKVDEDYGDTEERPSLTLQSASSNEYFIKVLHNRNPKARPRDKKPVKNISASYRCFRESILDILDGDEYKDSTSKVHFLASILDTFSRRFYLSIIIVGNKQEAFTIFETLNNRGKNLASSDLVKTHLLSLASSPEENQSFYHKWTMFSGAFQDDPRILNSFLREYWITRSGRESINELYRPISQQINSSLLAKNFLDDMIKLKDIYYAMLYPGAKYSKEAIQNHDILSYYHDLKQLGFKSYHPIFLAMYYHDFSEADILIVAHKILSLLIRFVSITGNAGRDMSPHFVRTAKNIWKGELADSQSINDYLNEANITDRQVTNTFRDWNRADPSHSQKATKYLLFNLEQYDEDDFVQGNFNFNDYNIISLDGANQYQLNLKDDNGFSYSEYIGNYTIIEKDLYKKNETTIERYFTMDRLIDILADSNLKHNYDLAEAIQKHDREWSVNDILDRQNDFQDLVAKIWK